MPTESKNPVSQTNPAPNPVDTNLPWEIAAFALQNTPPCARYEGGENDARLIAVWTYVAGLVGGGLKADNLSRKVARLYDYKGALIVATRRKLEPYVEALFRKAWSELGKENEEDVEFPNVQSRDWERYWVSRRFKSDWQHGDLEAAQ